MAEGNGRTGTMRVKTGLAQMLKGGVIMDVDTPSRRASPRRPAACAVMALERIPADIRAHGGVARMSDPEMIAGIQAAVTIPVMAKCRIGHFVEAQVLEALDVDFIDECEVLTPGRRGPPHRQAGLHRAVRVRRQRPGRGAAAHLRGRGDDPLQGRGRHGQRRRGGASHAQHRSGIVRLQSMPPEELHAAAKDLRAPYDLVAQVAADGRLPVVLFSAGGIATPADAALMLQLGAEGVFVGSGIYKSGDPPKRARAIVEAATHYRDPEVLARVSTGLKDAMPGLEISALGAGDMLQGRGW